MASGMVDGHFHWRASDLISLLMAAFASAFFIIVTVLCVVEVTSRITAFGYIERKSAEIEERLARTLDGTTANSSPARYSSELNQLSILRQISDELTILNFSGADSADSTVSEIRHRLTNKLSELRYEVSKGEILSNISDLRRRLFAREQEGMVPAATAGELLAEAESLGLNIGRLGILLSKTVLIDPADYSDNIPVRPVPSGETVITAISPLSKIIFDPETGEDFISVERLSEDLDVSSSYVFGLFNSMISQVSQSRLRALAEQNDGTSVANVRSAGIVPSLVQLYREINFAPYLATDILVAVSVILSGAIGAVAAATRSQDSSFLRAIVTGFLAGFVALLIVKGGKSLLYVRGGSDQLIIVNPYALAFAGVLAGLFTEKAFVVLTALVEELSARVTASDREQRKRCRHPTPVQLDGVKFQGSSSSILLAG